MWQEVYDEGSGRPFYFNPETNESRWDKPLEMEIVAAATNADSEWVHMIDDTSGESFYYNNVTGESQWDPPSSISKKTPDAQITSSQTSIEKLPIKDEDWVEVWDNNSQKYFYYNQTTGESAWDKPGVETKESSSLEVGQQILEENGIWEEAIDPDTGKAYYFNSISGEVQWEKPANFSSLANIPAESLPVENESAITKLADNDGMSLYSQPNLHLPTYTNQQQTQTAAHLSSSGNRSSSAAKRSGFVSAPDEFAAEFLTLTGTDDVSAGSGSESINGGQLDEDLERTLDELDDIDWAESSSQLISERILQIKASQLSSPQVLSYLSKKLPAFTIARFAELFFQYDRRGTTQIPANIIDKLIAFQVEPLKLPLTSLPTALANEAVSSFKDIQTFMTRSPGKSSTNYMEIAMSLIQRMLLCSSSELSDEIYVQLCKQTRRNPSPESTELGWQLMLILISSVPASKKVLPFLIHYFSVNVENLSDEAKRFAALCLKICLKSSSCSPRRELPTETEIHALLLGEELEIETRCIDGRLIKSKVDSFLKVEELEKSVTLALRVKEQSERMFGLCEVRDGRERPLNPSDRVVDILSVWVSSGWQMSHVSRAESSSNPSTQDQQSVQGQVPESLSSPVDSLNSDSCIFLYKVRFHLPVVNEDYDSVAMDLLYAQALHDVITAHYPHSLYDGLFLAALQLQISHGDFIVGKEIKEFRSASSAKSLCCTPWLDREEITRADAEARIIQFYKKLAGISKLQARNLFLRYVQSWKLYGAKYFVVKGQKDAAGSIVLAITHRAIILVDASHGSFLADYSYDVIYSWGHSFDSFVLAIGSKDSNVKSFFRTTQGSEIEELLRAYAVSSQSDEESDQ